MRTQAVAQQLSHFTKAAGAHTIKLNEQPCLFYNPNYNLESGKNRVMSFILVCSFCIVCWNDAEYVKLGTVVLVLLSGILCVFFPQLNSNLLLPSLFYMSILFVCICVCVCACGSARMCVIDNVLQCTVGLEVK